VQLQLRFVIHPSEIGKGDAHHGDPAGFHERRSSGLLGCMAGIIGWNHL
jgi:hypothetical protein